MKATARIISTYTGDTSGVCSALFELGGMTVMHDASGCNSTYNTHDEPRWYNNDSLVFLSGLTETEAIMGDDSKIIKDTVQAAQELQPKFIALAGSPIPMMTGVDFPALAREIAAKTGIPSFGFPSDGMHSYIHGASMAFAALAEHFCQATQQNTVLSVNLLGATPLDFSVNGTVEAICQVLITNEISINSVWAMNSSLTAIEQSAAATVNLVISTCGLAAAKILQQRFGTPYVIGVPYGEAFTRKIVKSIKQAAQTKTSRIACQPCENPNTVIIGESVTALSIANALHDESGKGATALCPVETCPELVSSGCLTARDEDDLLPFLMKAEKIIADPLYQPLCPATVKFIALPHEAFSGRIYRKEIPELVTKFDTFRKEFD